ncbi:MAG: GNAT family N-acetyltransferase [Maribacter sp.]|nr:GNAT family N-acetyltransferase [Maribacter sp.]MBT8302021.1 GNAT family N-acetyltransferase [Maribacter sp.]NND79742.1 GNAT family N-acetyltransferase [Maribacter sp.]
MMGQFKIIEVTPKNVTQETLFCSKDIKSNGFKCKQDWFLEQYEKGLRLKILKSADEKMLGFIEHVPAIHAWRPIEAAEFMFVHCIVVYSKKDRNKGLGSMLIAEVEKEAKRKGLAGVCVMSSKGAWIADQSIFIDNGYEIMDQLGRFELLSKKWDTAIPNPKLIDWTKQKAKYKGWNLIYANQCPWHEKSVEAILNTAMDFDIDLKITKLETAQEAKNAPSGFGVFSLLHDGKLIEDHYLSATRFRNILKKELQLGT